MEFSFGSPAEQLLSVPESLTKEIVGKVGDMKSVFLLLPNSAFLPIVHSMPFVDIFITFISSSTSQPDKLPKNIHLVSFEDIAWLQNNQKFDWVLSLQTWHHAQEVFQHKSMVTQIKAGGGVAHIGFFLPKISVEIDKVMHQLYTETLIHHWQPENLHLMDQFKRLPFPFKNTELIETEGEYYWSFSDWVLFMESWTAVREYRRLHQTSPVEAILPVLQKYWGTHKKRKVAYPFFAKVGLVI